MGILAFFKKASFVRTDFLLPRNTVVCGPFIADGSGEVDGRIKGDITVGGSLLIGKHAEIRGNINTAALEVHGTVQGNIFCGGKVAIASTAIIKGNVNAAVFDIKEGASIEGLIIKKDGRTTSGAVKNEPETAGETREEDVTGEAKPAETESEVQPSISLVPPTEKAASHDREVANWF